MSELRWHFMVWSTTVVEKYAKIFSLCVIDERAFWNDFNRRMDGSFDDSSIPGTSTQATPPATPPNPGIVDTAWVYLR